MASRTIQLRWRGCCCHCRTEVPAGEIARWDEVTHEISCLVCPVMPTEDDLDRPRRISTPSPAQQHSADERARVKRLVAEARAALDAAHRAG